MWDPKSPRKPLAVATGIACRYSETNVSFSPDGKYVLVGTAIDPRDENAVGEVLFLSSEDLKIVRRVPIAKASVIKVLWHSRINQVFCTLSNGQVYVLYSPQASIHGALLPLAKMPRTGPRDMSFTTADLTPVVFTPDAHGGIQSAYGQSLHQQQKAAKRFKPTEPVSGVGRGGRVGASATAGFVQDVFKRRLEPTEDVSDTSCITPRGKLTSAPRGAAQVRDRGGKEEAAGCEEGAGLDHGKRCISSTIRWHPQWDCAHGGETGVRRDSLGGS